MGMLAVRSGMNWIIGRFHWDSAIWNRLAIQVFTTKVPLRGFEARRKVDSLVNWKDFHICVCTWQGGGGGGSGNGGGCGCGLSVLLICVLVVLVVVAAPVGDFQAISWSALWLTRWWDQGINAEMYHKVFQPSTQTLQPACMQWMVFWKKFLGHIYVYIYNYIYLCTYNIVQPFELTWVKWKLPYPQLLGWVGVWVATFFECWLKDRCINVRLRKKVQLTPE